MLSGDTEEGDKEGLGQGQSQGLGQCLKSYPPPSPSSNAVRPQREKEKERECDPGSKELRRAHSSPPVIASARRELSALSRMYFPFSFPK